MFFPEILQSQLFVSTPQQLALLALIVFIASIVRGAIGFGFSAIVVASTSFWLPPIAAVCLTVILEVIASVIMFQGVQKDIDYKLLLPLSIGTLLASIIGVSILAIINPNFLQVLIAIYLATICIVSLIKLQLKRNPSTMRVGIAGALTGVINGMSAMGGLFVAFFMTGSNIPVARIRATMVVYFLVIEFAFLSSALLNQIYTMQIFWTSIVVAPIMFIGIALGTRLFNHLSEEKLKQLILYSLILLSAVGLIKSLLSNLS